jgi:hypothetical protein
MKCVKSVKCVEITLVTGYPDRDEIRWSGGGCASSFGPFQRIRKEEEKTFIKAIREYLEKTGKVSRVITIQAEDCGLRPTSKISRGKTAINKFLKYLDDESNW